MSTSGVPTRVSFVIGGADSAQRLAAVRREVRRSLRTAVIVLAVLFAICVYIASWAPSDPGFRYGVLALPIVVTFFVALGLSAKVFVARRVRPGTLSFSDDGIEFERDAKTKRYRWSTILRVTESAGVLDISMFRGPATALIIHKSRVPEADYEALVALFQRHAAKAFRPG